MNFPESMDGLANEILRMKQEVSAAEKEMEDARERYRILQNRRSMLCDEWDRRSAEVKSGVWKRPETI